MTWARRLGLLVQVHCESGPLIEELLAEALRAGRRGARLFTGTRPPEVEEESVAATMVTAALTGVPCYLVHLSSAEAIEQIRLARTRRVSRAARPPVFAEVCLHHLLLDDHGYDGPDAGRYLVCPPLRPAGHVEAMWQAIADGTIDAVGSDHCQTRSAVSDEITDEAGGTAGLGYGLAGIGARLPLLLSEGLARGVPIGRLVQLACENPARIFGHYPRKGVLAPGSDADIVVYDPAGERVLGEGAFGDGTGPSVYAGYRQRGSIRAVVRRGQLISAADELNGQVSGGHYLPAGSPAAVPGYLLASR
jgi:dihydropyrimidinase